MHRLLEPELMDDDDQVDAYAQADFSAPHSQFIQRLQNYANLPDFNGTALDLGCGPGDITRRFLQAYPAGKVDAVDGSVAMITKAQLLTPPALKNRVNFVLGVLPNLLLPQVGYDLVFSNSLLHHLPNPQVLWDTVKHYARSGSRIVMMDLLRPDTPEQAQALVKTYAADEPELLQRDFYHSLLAAFTLEEIKAQLKQARLPLFAEQISDRHVFIAGVIT